MNDATSPRRMIGTFVFLLAGPILWALQLTFTYGPQSALCAFGVGTSAGENPTAAWVIVLVSVLCIAIAALVFAQPVPAYRLLAGTASGEAQWPFLRGTMRILVALSILAMIYLGISTAFLPACAQLR